MRRAIVIGVFVGLVIVVTAAWIIGSPFDAPVVTTTSSAAAAGSAPSTGEPATGGSATPTSLDPALVTSTRAPTTTVFTPVRVPVREEPLPDPEPPAPAVVGDFNGIGTVVVGAGGADLYETTDGDPFIRAREGLPLAATGRDISGDWVQVFTTCNTTAWVRLAEVYAEPPATQVEIGAGFDFSDAVIVVDPGHGGPGNIGAVGGGLEEKTINLDISRRVRDLLETPIVVDWERGDLLQGEGAGDAVPAAERVLLTRVGSGPEGDYEAGLVYRSALANAAGAHAFVSIHNNAGWEVRLDSPGSEVFYQSSSPESRRFALLLFDEFHRGFAGFDADWVGSSEPGVKARLSPRTTGAEYYGVLRRTDAPSVIAEGSYLTNPSEAQLLATPEFRQAYAEAVYRALVRFLTTDEQGGAPAYDPEVWFGSAGSGDARPECLIPSQ